MTLTDAHERAGRGPPGRTPPTTSPPRWSTATVGEDMLTPEELGAVLHPPGRGRQRHHAHRHQPGHAPARRRTPDQRRIWQDDIEGVTHHRRGGDRALRLAGHVHATHGDRTGHAVGPGLQRGRTSSSCSTAPPTATPGCSTTPSASTCGATPTRTSASAGPGPHFCLGAHLARRELAVIFRQLFTRLPDIEVCGRTGPPRRPSASRWWAASSTSRCGSPPPPPRPPAEAPRRTPLLARAQAAAGSGVSFRAGGPRS